MTVSALDATTTRRPRSLLPAGADVVDAVALFVLGLLALVEFHTTFAGWNFLVVGALGLALGTVIAHLANVLRQPAIVLIVMGVAAFFLLGGAIALHGDPGASPIPTGGTLRNLADGTIHGWRDLLTTVPPVDGSGPLLVLPYVMGLFLGLGGFAVARRLRGVFWPVLIPLAVFVAVIVLGSLSAADTVATATAFAVCALLWIAIREQRLRPVTAAGSARATRVGLTAVLLALAGGGAYLVGPSLPGLSSGRVLVREHIIPPFNVGDYPSPLGEFRLYNQNLHQGAATAGLGASELFSVSGSLPAGSTIVFATLDAYNGSVWAVTNESGLISGKLNSFLSVGQELDNPAPGPRYSMDVTVDAYNDYWLPSAGAIQSVRFNGRNATGDASGFRYNLATGTGVVPTKIVPGDSYDLTVAGVTPPVLKATDDLSGGGVDQSTGAFIKGAATSLAGRSGSVTAQVLTLARNLKAQGRYTTGAPGSGFAYYLPGESVGRLTDFVNGVIPGVKYVGDDEQFAASFALMIEQLGVPARVLIGVESLPAGGVVRGRDVTAWVEVRAADGNWLTIPSSQFISTTPPDKNQVVQQTQQAAGSQVPPPAQGHPRSSLDNSASSNSSSRNSAPKVGHRGFALPGWLLELARIVIPPLALIALLCGAIVGVKALRRRRRRTLGSPAARVARGWREVVDHARDLGVATSVYRSTRREQAVGLEPLGVDSLAVLTDRFVFGPDPITDDDARAVWARADAERKRMGESFSRRRRWWAAVSLATFLPSPGAQSRAVAAGRGST